MIGSADADNAAHGTAVEEIIDPGNLVSSALSADLGGDKRDAGAVVYNRIFALGNEVRGAGDGEVLIVRTESDSGNTAGLIGYD
ncbi:MAG: hypothetical protein A2844_02640 [Candidatus Ryanbacteria bacterium RIFCSPHIGHO2_01_FULL_48_80]|nr:MAG: hypothetical protein A2844_02640 [Candidatus Ryanbacteria bacterium RIFCSPHIGHO2_01_FULL_48_80]